MPAARRSSQRSRSSSANSRVISRFAGSLPRRNGSMQRGKSRAGTPGPGQLCAPLVTTASRAERPAPNGPHCRRLNKRQEHRSFKPPQQGPRRACGVA
jgi:hypothetical protein